MAQLSFLPIGQSPSSMLAQPSASHGRKPPVSVLFLPESQTGDIAPFLIKQRSCKAGKIGKM
jgi:hypothetical protein